MTGSIFMPKADQIHESWFSEWGRQIGSERLGDALFKNARLKQRAYEHMVQLSDLELDFKYSDDEWIALNTYATQRDALLRICGMVIHGRLLRANIAKSEFELLTKSLPPEELRIAVNLRGLHIEDDDRAVDLPRVNQLIERSGANCLAVWRENLPNQSQLRLELLEEFEALALGSNGEVGPELAKEIVTQVSRALTANKVPLAA